MNASSGMFRAVDGLILVPHAAYVLAQLFISVTAETRLRGAFL